MAEPNQEAIAPNKLNAAVWLGMIAGLLTLINNIAAALLLGVGQAFIAPFTTPFAFATSRLLFPRLPAATIVYSPLLLVSIFTLNLGPPGPYKVFFLIAPVLCDTAGYLVGIHTHSFKNVVPFWKIWVAFMPYPLGLLTAAWLVLRYFDARLPMMESMKVAMIGVVFLWVIGTIGTWFAYKIFFRSLVPVIED